MKEDLREKILKDIQQSGFQTELEVASILKKKGWNVEPNTNYVDYDSKKSREIDIVAYKNPRNKSYVELHIVVEIKKSQRPWIIFTSKINQHLYHSYSSGLLKKFANYRKGFKKGNLVRKIPNRDFTRIGTSYKEAFKKPNEPSKIYDSLLSACKAATYKYHHEAPGNEYENHEYNPNYPIEIFIYHPIVIVEGILIEAFLDENGDIEISESDFIPVQLNYQAREIHENEFYCDVVTKKGLNEYCDKLDIWISDIIKEK